MYLFTNKICIKTNKKRYIKNNILSCINRQKKILYINMILYILFNYNKYPYIFNESTKIINN